MFTLAHLSDPHVPPLPGPTVGQLLNKRVLGYISWQRRRRNIHRAEVLRALVEDIHQQAPDHIAVTGDIVNISLPAEFRQAARWLAELGAPERTTVVPGNHDAYVAVDWRDSWGNWADYMLSDEAAPIQGVAGVFPILRRRGAVALIGLSTAVPTMPGRASGLLGQAQIAALRVLLDRLAQEGLFRVVLLHHSPLPGEDPWRKHLDDAEAFRHTIQEAGAELVLHGHNHRFVTGMLDGPVGPVPVFGVPSASALRYKDRPAAHYLIFRVGEAGLGWSLEVETRGYDVDTGRIQRAAVLQHLDIAAAKT